MEAAAVTSSLLQRAVLSLMLIYAVAVFFAPPMHPFHWIAGAFYLLVLFGGVHGAAKKSRGWLTFYWVSQFMILIFTLIAIMHALFLLIAEIRYRRAHPDDAAAAHSSVPEIKQMSKPQLIQFIIVNVCYLLTFLMVLILKVRSIVLAQRLIKQLQELPYAESDVQLEMQEEGEPLYVPQGAYEVEEEQQQQRQVAQPQPQQQQPVFMMANPQYMPQQGAATPMFPQGAFAIPPMMPYGQPQFMPVFVDQYGNVITPGQPTQTN